MTLINLIGCLEGNYTGYGVYTRGLWTALQRYGARDLEFIFTEFRQADELHRNIEKTKNYAGDVKNIWLQVGPSNQILDLFKGEKIAYTMYEASALPSGWVSGLNAVDRVFTPSSWGRDVMVANGVQSEKVDVVPGGVDAETFHIWGPRLNLPAEQFKFLMVGKYETRKGYDETLLAFKDVFGDDPSVLLLIKATSFVDQAAVDKIKSKINAIGIPQVKLVDGALEGELMGALYRSCDCLIYPSRGEGWGLPLIEAMSSGLPVITTNCSGHSEFLAPFPGRFQEIQCSLGPLEAEDHTKWYSYDHGPGDWYIPSYQSLCENLRSAFNWSKSVDRKALSLDVMKHFSWDVAARHMITMLVQ